MTLNSVQFSGKCLRSVPIYCGNILDGSGLCRLGVVVRCKWLRCHALIRVTKGSSASQGVSWIECLFPPPQLANGYDLYRVESLPVLLKDSFGSSGANFSCSASRLGAQTQSYTSFSPFPGCKISIHPNPPSSIQIQNYRPNLKPTPSRTSCMPAN
jgi:hypothetical protein